MIDSMIGDLLLSSIAGSVSRRTRVRRSGHVLASLRHNEAAALGSSRIENFMTPYAAVLHSMPRYPSRRRQIRGNGDAVHKNFRRAHCHFMVQSTAIL